MKHIIYLNKSELNEVISQTVKTTLLEGYLDDVYLSDNFKRWFKGSKIVDEEGRPLLLGHGTPSIGFHKFRTDFIHLTSINDVSEFACGGKRMFKNKETLNKLSDDDVLWFYNKYFWWGENDIYIIDDSSLKEILEDYDERELDIELDEELRKCFSEEELEKELKLLKLCRQTLLEQYKKYNGKLCAKPFNSLSKSPQLMPWVSDYESDGNLDFWLNHNFTTVEKLRKELIDEMFDEDNVYKGRAGIYPLCARVVNPLTVNCYKQPWHKIYIRPEGCNAYDDLYKKFCEHGLDKERSGFYLDNESIAYIARELGYDGVIFKNIREGGLDNILMKHSYIVFSTKQLKSPFENNGEFGDVENLFK